MRVGFVGLGMMGAPMARAVERAGFELMVWARRPDAYDEVPSARRAASLTELSAACDVLCVCVRDDDGVHEVVGATRPSLRHDAVVVVHSTVHPGTCKR